jgi:two-component system response regulator
MSGLEVLRKIRAEETTKMVPVVILTSSKNREDMNVAYELGANSYVLKPDGFDGYVKKIGSLAFYWSTVNESPSRALMK